MMAKEKVHDWSKLTLVPERFYLLFNLDYMIHLRNVRLECCYNILNKEERSDLVMAALARRKVGDKVQRRPPLETPSGIKNSSFMSIRGFPSTTAENSPPLSASLPDLSITDEELTSDRSSPNSEKDLLDGGFSPKPNDTVHSSSSEKGGESYGKSIIVPIDLMCLITGGTDSPDVQDVGREYGMVCAHHAIRTYGWAYRFPKTNTTVLYYWSASLCEIEPLNHSDPSTNFAMHLDLPAWFLHQNLNKFHVVVLNTGHHWNRGKLNVNKWKMYVNGKPKNAKHLRDIRSPLNFTVHSVVKWLDGELNEHQNFRAFIIILSPRHFFNGDWDSG
ncbi:hypothetical protein KI387_007220, partial [Taxus chinensis]